MRAPPRACRDHHNRNIPYMRRIYFFYKHSSCFHLLTVLSCAMKSGGHKWQR